MGVSDTAVSVASNRYLVSLVTMRNYVSVMPMIFFVQLNMCVISLNYNWFADVMQAVFFPWTKTFCGDNAPQIQTRGFKGMFLSVKREQVFSRQKLSSGEFIQQCVGSVLYAVALCFES